VGESEVAPSEVDPDRVALGLALGAKAVEAANAALATVEQYRTARTDVDRKFNNIVIASLVIARWLVTGESASADEMDWLGQVGEVSVADGTPLAVTTRGAMAWRDFLLRVVRDEGMRLESPAALVAEASQVVRASSDANLVRISRAYDENMSRLNAAIGHQALHDDLTGLPNRRLFLDRLANELAAGERNRSLVGVLLLDLDRFKEVNDTLGHDVGDQLLTSFALRLHQAMRSSDTIARMGGDEFAILPSGTDTVAELVVTAQKVLAATKEPFLILGNELPVRASIGVAAFPEHGADVATLMRRADIAMYAAKYVESGYAVYSSEQDNQFNARLALYKELRQAISGGELLLHFQPKVAIATRRTIAMEALVRWPHPSRGLLLPDEFIPVAEETDQITALTRWVLKNALSQLCEWREAGIDTTVCINLSARNLAEADLVDHIKALLEQRRLSPGKVILEITESTLIPRSVDACLRSLRALGVGLAIDDYGTGYSSLMHLRRLPLTELKLDRTFIREVTTVRADEEIVRATISLGHRLGLSISAEGVADETTLKHLQAMDCDAVQGFYIAPPMPPGDIPSWLRTSSWPLAHG
jgi:diguanylate cyclase (GGDEF)-like protein